MAVLREATLGQIAIAAANPGELAGFYRETLGLQFLFDAGGMYFFSVGGVRLMIGPRPPNHPAGNSILYFKVADIVAAHSGLSERGVKFIAAPHRIAALADRDLWLAEFSDSAGNALALMAEIPRRQPQ